MLTSVALSLTKERTKKTNRDTTSLCLDTEIWSMVEGQPIHQVGIAVLQTSDVHANSHHQTPSSTRIKTYNFNINYPTWCPLRNKLTRGHPIRKDFIFRQTDTLPMQKLPELIRRILCPPEHPNPLYHASKDVDISLVGHAVQHDMLAIDRHVPENL